MASNIIEFEVVFNYGDQEEGIEIPLALNANGRSMMTVGFVDTGCGACLFSNEIGMELGIDIESGEFAIFKSGAGGSVPAYGHPVVIEFLGIAFESFVYFAKFPGLQRSLLGRAGFLRKLRFGLIEYDTTALFAALS
jgi:predicted aspartyl protease